MKYSIIIPAKDESKLILQTIEGIERAIEAYSRVSNSFREMEVEVVLVDDNSKDDTVNIVNEYYGTRVKILRVNEGSCGRSRNRGAANSLGDVLVFVDADTIVPEGIFIEIDSFLNEGKIAGLYSLASREPGFLGNSWWRFWGAMRLLPVSYSKAMPACSFCIRDFFLKNGGFNEGVAITEEWSIFATLYLNNRSSLIWKTHSYARTSSRRVDGYRKAIIMFYFWSMAVFFSNARKSYPANLYDVCSKKPNRLFRLVDYLMHVVLCRTEINSVSRLEENIYKVRRFYSTFVVYIANGIFHFIGEPLRVLGNMDWKEYEANRFSALYGYELSKEKGILFPILNGRSLREILLDRNVSEEIKLNAISLAVLSLSHLHSTPYMNYYGHGDAHAGNVLVDISRLTASWFDFETRLDSSLLRSEQIAYDLTILLLSVAEYWKDAPLEGVLKRVFDCEFYSDLLIKYSVNDSFMRLLNAPTVFERARYYNARDAVYTYAKYLIN